MLRGMLSSISSFELNNALDVIACELRDARRVGIVLYEGIEIIHIVPHTSNAKVLQSLSAFCTVVSIHVLHQGIFHASCGFSRLSLEFLLN